MRTTESEPREQATRPATAHQTPGSGARYRRFSHGGRALKIDDSQPIPASSRYNCGGRPMRSLLQCCSSFRWTSWLRAALCVPLCLFSLFGFGFAAAPAPADENLEAAALTLIEKRCLACHNPGTKSSELDLSTLEAARRGGTKGPALVAGTPDESLLYRRVAAGEMPLGDPLPEEERELLRRWIEAGSLWSKTLASGPPA